MLYEVEVNGCLRQVRVHRANGRFTAVIDGRERTVDAARVDAHMWSLLVEEAMPLKTDTTIGADGVSPLKRTAASHEVSIITEPVSGRLAVHVGSTPMAVSLNGRRRWGRRDEGGPQGSAPQRIVATMPGKIIRVVVKPGEAVRARQPVVVIEAMKMENELSAVRDGIVADVQVRDGQSVDAGTLLVVIV